MPPSGPWDIERRMRSLLLLLLLGACAKSPRTLYVRELEDNTELGVVYRGFATALRFRATYLSPTFRTELANERQRLLGESPEEHQRFLAVMADDNSAYHEVVFTAESDIETQTEFGDSDAHWRVKLFANGTEEQLITVYHVREPTALHHMIYAHKNLWNELWIARFARTVTDPTEVKFAVGSGWGHDEVSWDAEQVR
jgi:hypothetical protein